MVKKIKRKRRGGRKRGKYKSTKMGVEMTYRSGWELEYFHFLDKCDEVLQFFSESIKIAYTSNVKTGKKRNYIPDLYVIYSDGSRKILEIKPKSKILQRTNLKKFSAAREFCIKQGMEFQVITEVDLKALGLLK